MSNRRMCTLTPFILACIPSTALAADARLFMIRQGDDPSAFPAGPTILTIRPGDSITLDIFVENTAPAGLLTSSIFLYHARDGDAGTVQYRPGSEGTDPTRPDYAFTTQAYILCFAPPPVNICATNYPAPGVVITKPRYIGELQYVADDDACGTFTIEFYPESLLVDDRAELIPYTPEPVVLHVTHGGDADLDNDVDLTDFAILKPCSSGPHQSPDFIDLTGDCICLDLDNDDDIDLNDFAVFQQNFTGPSD